MTDVILLMAGLGERMGMNKNKMLLSINDKPLYQIIIDKFAKHTDNIILVVSENDLDYFKSLNLKYKIVIGGKTRTESVKNALLESTAERVLIHDGARILVSDRIISDCLHSTRDAYFTAIELKNTIRYDQTKQFETLDRSHLLDVQTPQGGLREVFLRHALNLDENKNYTDDISMLENVDVEVIKGEERNIKITTPNDLKLAKFYLEDDYV